MAQNSSTHQKPTASGPIWANLLHLGYNMWIDNDNYPKDARFDLTARPYLRCDQSLWDDLVRAMARGGMNMLVIDLGDGVRYQSHPELGVEGAWSVGHLREELAKIRALGIEPIPKLNFGAGHDVWLGPYARMVSSQPYYEVCADLIAEVSELFDHPRFFHLGMDEEDYPHQSLHEYVVIRQKGLWWHDLLFFVNEVEKAGGRPWTWSDYVWRHPEDFYANMPKSVVQSNWYYHDQFDNFGEDDTHIKNVVGTYLELDRQGYDQIPTGSYLGRPGNFEMTVKYCRANIAPQRLLGFLTAPWKPTLEGDRAFHLQSIAEAKAVIDAW